MADKKTHVAKGVLSFQHTLSGVGPVRTRETPGTLQKRNDGQ